MRDVRCIVLAWTIGYPANRRTLMGAKVIARYETVGLDMMDVVHLRRMGYGVIIL